MTQMTERPTFTTEGKDGERCAHCAHPSLQHLARVADRDTGTYLVTCSLCRCTTNLTLDRPAPVYRRVGGLGIDTIDPNRLHVFDPVGKVLNPKRKVCRDCRHDQSAHESLPYASDSGTLITVVRCRCGCTTLLMPRSHA